MAIWRIKSWSRELARGSVEDGSGRVLEFDGSRALVDDFTIGEQVEFELARSGDAIFVRKIWPRYSRVPGSDVNAPVAAPIEGAVARVNEALGARECVVTVTCFDGLQLTLLVSDRYSNLCAALRFAGPSYTQLDWWFDASGHTLRAYRLLRWVKHNQRVYQHWSMDEDEFEDELLFAFEPKHFKDKARYIIAEGLEVDTSVSGVP